MYWDGLVYANKDIESAILVAETFDAKVQKVIENINKKSDAKGNKYNITYKESSKF